MAGRIRKLAVFVVSVLVAALAPIHANGDGPNRVVEQFDIPRDGGLATVPVTIKGRRYEFFVDTGSNVTVCDKSLQPLLGTPVARTRASTAHGFMASLVFRSSEMAVGRIPIKDGMHLLVSDLTLMRQADDADICGILGMDFLGAHVVSFDFDRGQLRFLASADGLSGRRLALAVKGGIPRITAAVRQVGEIEFIIDTGRGGLTTGMMSRAIFADLLKRRVVLEGGTAITATPNGRTASRSGLLTGLSVAGFEHADLIFDQTADYSVLGLGYWSRYTATFDFPNATLYLTPSQRFDRRDLRDMSGLHLLRINGQATVYSVDVGSAAEQRGIRARDCVLTVDDVDASRTRLEAVRQMLCAEGASVRLTIRRGEKTEAVVLSLRDWRTSQHHGDAK
ncbi:MAG TPA: aspartyl protease family protein [Pirellulales bacterium]|nr:aspartyl protease family protein [Pirellulales bacterium]